MSLETDDNSIAIHQADVLRSLDLIATSWNSDEYLDADDMILHLEEMVEVASGKSDTKQFTEATGLTERLN